MQKHEITEQLARDIAKLFDFHMIEIEKKACADFPSQEDYDLDEAAERIRKFLVNRKVKRT